MRKTPKTKAETEPHPQKIDVSSQRAEQMWDLICIGKRPNSNSTILCRS